MAWKNVDFPTFANPTSPAERLFDGRPRYFVLAVGGDCLASRRAVVVSVRICICRQ